MIFSRNLDCFAKLLLLRIGETQGTADARAGEKHQVLEDLSGPGSIRGEKE